MEVTSSKYVTSEDPTFVRDTFHGVDVQLDGYRVTLTINGLTQQDFDNYTLRLYSGNQYVEHMVVLESSSMLHDMFFCYLLGNIPFSFINCDYFLKHRLLFLLLDFLVPCEGC